MFIMPLLPCALLTVCRLIFLTFWLGPFQHKALWYLWLILLQHPLYRTPESQGTKPWPSDWRPSWPCPVFYVTVQDDPTEPWGRVNVTFQGVLPHHPRANFQRKCLEATLWLWNPWPTSRIEKVEEVVVWKFLWKTPLLWMLLFVQSPISMDGLHRCTLIPGLGCPRPGAKLWCGGDGGGVHSQGDDCCALLHTVWLCAAFGLVVFKVSLLPQWRYLSESTYDTVSGHYLE